MNDQPNSNAVVIFGCGPMSQMFTNSIVSNSLYRVNLYVEDKENLSIQNYLGKPVVRLDEISDLTSLSDKFYVAIGYSDLNYVREKYYKLFKEIGYSPLSYFHLSSQIDLSVKLGEHIWVMEKSVIQCDVIIGNNVVIHIGALIAHHSTIGDNCFIAQGVNICGYVNIGNNCFVGAGAIILNNIVIGDNCVIAAGAIVRKNMASNTMIIGNEESIFPDARNKFNQSLSKIKQGMVR